MNATPSHSGWSLGFVIGILGLLVAFGASLWLALDHFAIARTPGCGVGSGCDQITRGPWGRIPGLNWPLSLVGVAYFAAMMTGWLVTRGITSRIFRAIASIGALVSVALLIVMFTNALCPYCLAVHIGNLVFVAMALVHPPAATIGGRASLRDLSAAVTAAVVAAAALIIVNAQTSALRQQRNEEQLAQSTRQIIEKSSADAAGDAQRGIGMHAPPGGFTGRWRMGPEDAPIRIVIFSDYQCRDCKAVEQQVRTILAQRDDVSVSAKHFPFAADCNRHLNGVTLHPNACWAARAAEAAGLLHGNDGFWKMHQWLFDRGGGFTDAELDAALPALGFDPQEFIRVMSGSQTLEHVTADVEEGYALGLFFTPMVFINGVELRGVINNSTAVNRAVEALAATNPPRATALSDKPPLAIGKALADWEHAPHATQPPRQQIWSLGRADAPIKVWVWGDYQLPQTAELDREIHQAMKQHGDIQYIFRHYPVDRACNSHIRQTVSPHGCLAARIGEAAGVIGGNEAYWKMHQWLLSNQQFTTQQLRAAAQSMNIEPDQLLATAESPAIQAAVQQDIDTGRPMIHRDVPAVYVNGKWVPRWKMDQGNVLQHIFEHLRNEQ